MKAFNFKTKVISNSQKSPFQNTNSTGISPPRHRRNFPVIQLSSAQKTLRSKIVCSGPPQPHNWPSPHRRTSKTEERGAEAPQNRAPNFFVLLSSACPSFELPPSPPTRRLRHKLDGLRPNGGRRRKNRSHTQHRVGRG